MIISAMMIALLVYLFLALFQPFGTYTYTHSHKYWLLIPYAFISFALFFTSDYLMTNKIINWTFKNEILKTSIVLLFCAALNYVYSIYFINHSNFSFKALFNMVLFTYTLGLPICAIMILGKYAFLKNTEAKELPNEINIKSKVKVENRLTIIPDTGSSLHISKNQFLYAQSEGNYSYIYFIHDTIVSKKLLRISLKKLEEQIGDSSILRCHRSYILNIENALHQEGNSQGLRISLKFIKEKIPVSRKYIDKIKK